MACGHMRRPRVAQPPRHPLRYLKQTPLGERTATLYPSSRSSPHAGSPRDRRIYLLSSIFNLQSALFYLLSCIFSRLSSILSLISYLLPSILCVVSCLVPLLSFLSYLLSSIVYLLSSLFYVLRLGLALLCLALPKNVKIRPTKCVYNENTFC